MFDPRTHFQTWNITEAVNPRSPWGQPGNSPAFQPGRPPEQFAGYLRRLSVPEEAIQRTCSASDVNMARLAKYAEDYYSLCSCIGACVRVPLTQVYSPAIAAQLFTAATGLEMEAGELMQAGERSWNMLKAMNMREGFGREDDKFPKTFFEPLVVEGNTFNLRDYYGKPLSQGDIEKLLGDYYDERGWDVKKGIPTRQKFIDLGLGSVAADLERLGLL
jgi:aldehyde:ferredoxin oxidoreductase